jgi:hypothetical protein
MMTTIYKLTDQDMRTHNGFQWTLNKEETASGEGNLCGPGFLHAYTDPLLAILLNPIHADIKSPRLFKGTGTVSKTDNGLKIGCTKITLTEEMELPVVTTNQRIAFGILCAKQVYNNQAWNHWADNWMSGKDRTARAARAAARAAAEEAARAAAWEAAEEAARAAAWEAARAAEAAAAEARARARAWAWAAWAWAWEADKKIDLIALARKAMEVK